MTKAHQAQASREKLIAAAEGIVLKSGISRMTLEAVAAEAGVSKGGLLYHFASKEALIKALVENLVASFQVDLEKAYLAEPEGPGRATRAMILESRSRVEDEREKQRERIGAALLAAAGNDPALLEPMRHAFSNWMKTLGDDGLAPGVPLVIAAALDGFLLWGVFGLYQPPESAMREAYAVFARLISTEP